MREDLSILDICYRLSVSRNWIYQKLKNVEVREATLLESKLLYAGQKKLYKIQSLLDNLYKMTDFYLTLDYADALDYAINTENTTRLYTKLYVDKTTELWEKRELIERFEASLNQEGNEIIERTAIAFYKDTEREPVVRITDEEEKKFLFENIVKPIFYYGKLADEEEFPEPQKLNTMYDMKDILKLKHDELVYRKIYAAEFITIKIAGRTYYAHCSDFFERKKSRCRLPIKVYPGKE